MLTGKTNSANSTTNASGLPTSTAVWSPSGGNPTVIGGGLNINPTIPALPSVTSTPANNLQGYMPIPNWQQEAANSFLDVTSNLALRSVPGFTALSNSYFAIAVNGSRSLLNINTSYDFADSPAVQASLLSQRQLVINSIDDALPKALSLESIGSYMNVYGNIGLYGGPLVTTIGGILEVAQEPTYQNSFITAGGIGGGMYSYAIGESMMNAGEVGLAAVALPEVAPVAGLVGLTLFGLNAGRMISSGVYFAGQEVRIYGEEAQQWYQNRNS